MSLVIHLGSGSSVYVIVVHQLPERFRYGAWGRYHNIRLGFRPVHRKQEVLFGFRCSSLCSGIVLAIFPSPEKTANCCGFMFLRYHALLPPRLSMIAVPDSAHSTNLLRSALSCSSSANWRCRNESGAHGTEPAPIQVREAGYEHFAALLRPIPGLTKQW